MQKKQNDSEDKDLTLDIVETAMAEELKASGLYKKISAQLEDKAARLKFNVMSDAEQRHYEQLKKWYEDNFGKTPKDKKIKAAKAVKVKKPGKKATYEDKIPHIAIAKDIIVTNDGEHIAFKSWFCVKSLENLAYNSNVAVGTYNIQERLGYQFIGKVVSKNMEAVLNGYAPELESIEAKTPQEEYKLKIKVESILELHFGTHSDKSIV